ncbi:hypothetical protein Tco_0111725, partial [Tanacetum coccineum]
MYVRGKVNYLDNIDVDLFNVNELRMFLQDLGVDHQYLSPFKSTIEIEELDDDVLLNAPVVGSSKRLSLVNMNDYIIDDRFELDINENLNLDDYTVYVDENMNENVNTDDENVNADDEYEQDDVEDEEVIGNDREDFIVDEEHVIDEVEVNMQGFTFSVQEQGAEQTITPNVDLTDEALEVLDFDSFDSDVGNDTA